MKIFISWKGDQSKAVALKLRNWIPMILQYADPWMSEIDISSGSRWSDELANKLEEFSLGILCLTRENMQSPWILFEAGALAKSVKSGVIVPYLLDVDFTELVNTPLTQFQGKKADEKSTLEMLRDINSKAVKPIPENQMTEVFEAMWPRLRDAIIGAPKENSPVKANRRTEDVLEELVQLVRSMDQRLNLNRSPEKHITQDRKSSRWALPTAIDQIRFGRLSQTARTTLIQHLLGDRPEVAIAALMEHGFSIETADGFVIRWLKFFGDIRVAAIKSQRSDAIEVMSKLTMLPPDICECLLDNKALRTSSPESPPPT